jgi:hypothetical protein
MPFHPRFSRSQKGPRLALAGFLLGALLTAGAAAQAPGYFDPSAPDKFDGHGWNGLTLEQSTTDDIKRAFKTSKGAYRPEAMVLPQPSGSQVNVQVLMDGRGGQSRLVGFRLAYSGIGPDLQRLADSLGAQSETVYPLERFSDWRVQVFRQAGIAAFAVREGVRETVPLLLLTTTGRVDTLVQGFSDSPSPIGNLRKRFKPEDVEIKFGQTNVSFSRGRSDISDADSLASRIQSMAQDDPGSRNLRYSVGSRGGVYNVDIAFDKPGDDHGGTVGVSITVTGDGPFGKVSASGYGSTQLASGSGNVSQEIIVDTFRKARNQMGSTMTDQIRKGLPSSPKAYREQVWNALTDAAVR